MRKTYLYIFIVSLLALVIFASGCTQNNTNQTNQSNTGTYSVNGLSFNYPIEWILASQTNGNVHFINIVDQTYGESNGTKGNLVEIISQPKSENLTYENVKNNLTNSSSIKNTTDNTVNIAGLTGNMTTFTATDASGNQTQIKLIYFEKNNFVYMLNFVVTGGASVQDQQKYFDTIVNSFKVP